MAKEHEIVSFINQRLSERQFASKRFKKGSIDGIAELIGTDQDETKPCIVDNYGDATQVSIDDTKPFQIYHRVIKPNAEWNVEQEFGDPKRIKETTEMLMVVMGDRNRLKLTAEDIKTAIAAALPLELPKSELTTTGLIAANIIPGTFNWDREEVYNSEFKLNDNLLKTKTIMFSFSYQIETVYDQTCFVLCE